MSDLNIYQRINAVMKEVTYVQKDSSITGMGGGYKAVTHDQVVSVIRASLVKNGIVLEVEQLSGEFIIKRDLAATPPIKMGLYEGNYRVFSINIDKPDDRACITIVAHANDNGDKAPGKAATYAVKTALLKQYTLETGENEESRAEDAMIAARKKSLTRSDLMKYIQECGYTSDQVCQGMNGVEFAQLNIQQAFDMVTFWKQQQ